MSKKHLTVDNKTSVCTRPGVKELTTDMSQMECRWCDNRLRDDKQSLTALVMEAHNNGLFDVVAQLLDFAKTLDSGASLLDQEKNRLIGARALVVEIDQRVAWLESLGKKT